MRTLDRCSEFGVELNTDKPRMVRVFDDLNQISIRVDPGHLQSTARKDFAMVVAHLVPVPMPLPDVV